MMLGIDVVSDSFLFVDPHAIDGRLIFMLFPFATGIAAFFCA